VDGGILRVDVRRYRKQTGLSFEEPPSGSRAAWPYRALARRVLRARLGALPAALDDWLCAGVPDPDLCPDAQGPGPAARSDRPSGLAEHVLRTARAGEAVQQRRANWERLQAGLRELPGCEVLHKELPAGACPLGFVLRSSQRQALVRALVAVGVEPYVFGANPHATLPVARFPGASRLRNELLCLPVHHALTRTQVERVVAVLAGTLKGRAADPTDLGAQPAEGARRLP
jgi:hypothetical protein